MKMWLFFTIFGLVITIPSLIIFLVINRFRNTIAVLIKRNGALVKIVIDNATLERGKITEYNGKKIKPITISKEEIYFGKWRRWIIKPELHSTINNEVSDKEIEEYLNNEDLIKLYLAGKFKDTLFLLLGLALFCIIVAGIVNGYLTVTHECILTHDNATTQYLHNIVKSAIIGG